MSWPMEQIGDHVEKIETCNPKVNHLSSTFKYIDLGSVDKDTKSINANEVNYIKAKDSPSRARQIVKHKDILVSTVRPNLNGVAQVEALQFSGAIASTGYCVLRPKSTKLNARYLLHWVKSPQFIANMVKLATGANYPAVSDRIIKSSLIPLPPLKEQKRIAAILDKADALRRKREKAIQLTDTLLRSVFLDMFGDPVTNPKGWEVKKLDDLCDVGSSKRVFVDEFVKEGIPFYRGTEVGKLGAGGKIKPKLFISSQHYENLIKHSGKPNVGDLLLPSICHDGRLWKVNHNAPFYFKDGRVLWIKNNQSHINSDYLKSYLQQIFIANYASIASGTTFAELKIINLKNLSILLPPTELQKNYAEIFKLHSQYIQKLTKIVDLSDVLVSSLTQRAFRGELTSKDLNTLEAAQ